MLSFEYVVVPAPKRAPKIKGAKTVEARFATALSDLMNAYGAEGWEYVRSDTLPCEERSGFTGTKTVFQNMLVFRRVLEDDSALAMPEADNVPTPEELARSLPGQADPALQQTAAPEAAAPAPQPVGQPAANPRFVSPPRAEPAAAPAATTEPLAAARFLRAPSLSTLRETGSAPRVGPAGEAKTGPRSGADRFEGR